MHNARLDKEGYRPNVGIIIINEHNQVFWAKRARQAAWQFPQGGIKPGESPETAMYRELHEEVGLLPHQVRLIARTKDWSRYDVPQEFRRRDGVFRGQKQIWFLLSITCRDCDINLRTMERPEFDAWRWHDYWATMNEVIYFKRDVYHCALHELAAHLPSLID